MTAPKATKAAMQRDLRAKEALLQEQEVTIGIQRTEIMDLKSRLTQQRAAARKGNNAG